MGGDVRRGRRRATGRRGRKTPITTTPPTAPGRRRAAPPRRVGALLAAATVGGVLAAGAVLVAEDGVRGPAPEVVTAAERAPASSATAERAVAAPPATSAAPAPAAPARPDVDSPAARAYLAALRAADVPTSRTGAPEVEVAQLVCERLSTGVDREQLGRAIPRVLPTVTKAQGRLVVDAAAEHVC